jgi:hypothetical protein
MLGQNGVRISSTAAKSRFYWMAIGFFAGIVGRPVRELALITLIHELSHAYTHLDLAHHSTSSRRRD